MGFFDSVQSSINRGVAGANRASSSMKLKAQLNDAIKRRQALAAQLGASLYDVTKDDPIFRAGREAIYDGIASIDEERAACQAQIERIEAEAQAAQVAATRYACPFCGSSVAASDLFCSGCGKSMAEIEAALSAQQPQQPAAAGATCPSCGAPVNADDAFCMSCGAVLAAAPAFGEAGEPALGDEPPAAAEDGHDQAGTD